MAKRRAAVVDASVSCFFLRRRILPAGSQGSVSDRDERGHVFSKSKSWTVLVRSAEINFWISVLILIQLIVSSECLNKLLLDYPYNLKFFPTDGVPPLQSTMALNSLLLQWQVDRTQVFIFFFFSIMKYFFLKNLFFLFSPIIHYTPILLVITIIIIIINEMILIFIIW